MPNSKCEQLRDQIDWLKDDAYSCRAAMRSATDVAEKTEFRMRAQADEVEIARLEKELEKMEGKHGKS